MKKHIRMRQRSTDEILSGRTTDRNGRHKYYNSIRFSGWTISKRSLIHMLERANSYDPNSLKQSVRVTISEVEGAIKKLSEYPQILEQLNSTKYSNSGISAALKSLKSSSLDQTDIHTP